MKTDTKFQAGFRPLTVARTDQAIHAAHAANRLRAIFLMLAELPSAKDAGEVRRIADALASWADKVGDDSTTRALNASRRACWAQRSGMKGPPSPETWSDFVAAARLRRPVSVEQIRSGTPSHVSPFRRVRMSEGL